MQDIVDYSRKLQEESKKQRKVFIIICLVVAIFTFSIGFYFSYAFNNNTKSNSYKNKFDSIYSTLKDDWYYGIEDEELEKTLIDRAINGMLDTQKDPFTRYITSVTSLDDSYEGLGIEIIEYKEYFLITEVKSKMNIDSGFKNGDLLLSIDGNSLENKDADYIRELIKDKDSVSIVVKRNNQELTLIGYISVYSPVTVFKDFSLSENIAYVKITEFAKDTATNLEKYLKEAKDENYNKIIIDLRDNPGGYIDSVVDCVGLFVDKGKVVLTTKDKNGNEYSYKTRSNSKYDFENIIILINNGSASGAEAFSAALNETIGDKVDLMGVTTYGKGSAQNKLYFTDGTYLNYTYALWYTPNNNSIHKVGVQPEIIYTGSGIHLLSFDKTVTLEKSNYGSNVYNLQAIMKTLGYYDGELTSFFDDTLESALVSFQEDNEIATSGKLDELTIRYILSLYNDSKEEDYRKEVMQVLTDYNS